MVDRLSPSPHEALAPTLPAKPVAAPAEPVRINRRQLTFRCARLTIAAGLISCAVLYARSTITTVRSEQAFINAEITPIRAPIAGELRLNEVVSGRRIAKGTELFTVTNDRFGNEQVASQMNWVTELAQRSRAEANEAAVRLRQQQTRTALHEQMFADGILPRIELVEEQSKLAMAATVLTNKLELAQKAEERLQELKQQVRLQESATVRMPFDSIGWSTLAKNSAQVALNETLIEVFHPERIWIDAFFHQRHAERLAIGRSVTVETMHGEALGRGTIEWVRGGVGRIPYDGVTAVQRAEHAPNRIAVRVRLETGTQFEPSQFCGVGLNVVVKAEAL